MLGPIIADQFWGKVLPAGHDVTTRPTATAKLHHCRLPTLLWAVVAAVSALCMPAMADQSAGIAIQVAQSSDDDMERQRQEIEAKWQKEIDDFWRLHSCALLNVPRNCKLFRDDAIQQRDAEIVALGAPVEVKVKCGRLSGEGCGLLNGGVGEIEARWTRIVAEYWSKNGCNGWMTPRHCDTVKKDSYVRRDAEIEELGRQARSMAGNCSYRDEQECRALHVEYVRRLVEIDRKWWGVMDDYAHKNSCYRVRSLPEHCAKFKEDADLERLMEIKALESDILAQLAS
jgi:hypothetical protein